MGQPQSSGRDRDGRRRRDGSRRSSSREGRRDRDRERRSGGVDEVGTLTSVPVQSVAVGPSVAVPGTYTVGLPGTTSQTVAVGPSVAIPGSVGIPQTQQVGGSVALLPGGLGGVGTLGSSYALLGSGTDLISRDLRLPGTSPATQPVGEPSIAGVDFSPEALAATLPPLLPGLGGPGGMTSTPGLMTTTPAFPGGMVMGGLGRSSIPPPAERVMSTPGGLLGGPLVVTGPGGMMTGSPGRAGMMGASPLLTGPPPAERLMTVPPAAGLGVMPGDPRSVPGSFTAPPPFLQPSPTMSTNAPGSFTAAPMGLQPSATMVAAPPGQSFGGSFGPSFGHSMPTTLGPSPGQSMPPTPLMTTVPGPPGSFVAPPPPRALPTTGGFEVDRVDAMGRLVERDFISGPQYAEPAVRMVAAGVPQTPSYTPPVGVVVTSPRTSYVPPVAVPAAPSYVAPLPTVASFPPGGASSYKPEVMDVRWGQPAQGSTLLGQDSVVQERKISRDELMACGNLMTDTALQDASSAPRPGSLSTPMRQSEEFMGIMHDPVRASDAEVLRSSYGRAGVEELVMRAPAVGYPSASSAKVSYSAGSLADPVRTSAYPQGHELAPRWVPPPQSSMYAY